MLCLRICQLTTEQGPIFGLQNDQAGPGNLFVLIRLAYMINHLEHSQRFILQLFVWGVCIWRLRLTEHVSSRRRFLVESEAELAEGTACPYSCCDTFLKFRTAEIMTSCIAK